MGHDSRPSDRPVLDPWAAAALPTLLHKLGNCTQLLTGVHAILGMPDGDELLRGREGDLARAGADVERLGWCLAVLASGSGADLLLSRRAPEGLRWMVDLVLETGRRAGRPVQPPSGPLPELDPAAPDGWRVPFAVGSLLWAAAQDRPEGTPLSWVLQPLEGVQRLAAAGGPHVGRALERVRELLPEARATRADCGAFTLELPAAWLRMPG